MKEIEINFRCTNKDLQAIAHVTNLSSDYILERPYPYKAKDTYLDTPEVRLLQKDASFRGREKGGQFRVPFKSHPSIRDSQLTREEWEKKISKEDFFALLASGQMPGFIKSSVTALIGEHVLMSVLNVQNQRLIRDITHIDRGLVEVLALDNVTFLRSGKEMQLFGIEVEIKGVGKADDLEKISAGLVGFFPDLKPDAESKYEKGMHLLQ